MREINAIDLLIKEFLVPIAPNSVLGAAIYRSVEETACASSCLYELARDNSKSNNTSYELALTPIRNKCRIDREKSLGSYHWHAGTEE